MREDEGGRLRSPDLFMGENVMTDNELLQAILAELEQVNDLLECGLFGLFMVAGFVLLRIIVLRSTI